MDKKAFLTIIAPSLIISCCYSSICSWNSVRLNGMKEEMFFPEPALLQDGEKSLTLSLIKAGMISLKESHQLSHESLLYRT